MLYLASTCKFISPKQDDADRLEENGQVKEKPHILDIVQVVLQLLPGFLLGRGIRVHDLRPTRKSWFYQEAITVMGQVFLVIQNLNFRSIRAQMLFPENRHQLLESA